MNIRKKRSAISPVIAHIFLIAIVVIGGTGTVVFAQDSYNILQLSGYPEVELITITGFDARDKYLIEAHNGPVSNSNIISTFHDDGVKGLKEVVTVYVKNDSVKKVLLKEVTLAGSEYEFFNPAFSVPFGKYAIISKNLPAAMVMAPAPQLEPGQEATLIFSLDSAINLGRNLQVKITTGNEFVSVGTITTGEQKN